MGYFSPPELRRAVEVEPRHVNALSNLAGLLMVRPDAYRERNVLRNSVSVQGDLE